MPSDRRAPTASRTRAAAAIDDDDVVDADEYAEPRGRGGKGALARSGARPQASPRRRRAATTNRWMRWLHVYASMICFVVVLFFGVTGLTLNHPSWTFGDPPSTHTYTGDLPASYMGSNGTVDFLAVSEFVRNKYDVRGEVSQYGVDGNQGTISYKSAGYAADLFFAVDKGTYKLDVAQAGLVGLMNDLHKGRDTASSWNWVIDLSAIFLVFVALTGLGIQVFQRKRRTRAIIFAGAGGVLAVILTLVAIH